MQALLDKWMEFEWLQAKGGYTAFKGGPAGKWRAHEPPATIDKFVKAAYMMREWVGDEVDLLPVGVPVEVRFPGLDP